MLLGLFMTRTILHTRDLSNSTFSFENTYTDVVMKVINNLNVAKTCQVNDIPAKAIKINKGIFANLITDHFNYCIVNGE